MDLGKNGNIWIGGPYFPNPTIKPGPGTGSPVPDTTVYPDPESAHNHDTSVFASSLNSKTWLADLEKKAANGDEAAYDKLINYYMTQESEKTARDWTASREDSAYQRLMADFKKAGISPYVLSGGQPTTSSYYGKSYSGSQMTSSGNNEATTGTSALRGVMTLFGMLIAAMLAAA